MTKHLLTLYTRTPLHIGCGTSVDVIDLPIMRERITAFPVIPGSSLKGVLLQAAREQFDGGRHSRSNDGLPEEARVLFGSIEKDGGEHVSNAGCIQVMEAKLLAFPVRSLAGCFAWITCPAVLERFKRDTGMTFDVPRPERDHAAVGSDLIVNGKVVLEEYALACDQGNSVPAVAAALNDTTGDPLWNSSLAKRLAIVNDENFQHFVTTCTEVVTRVKIDPRTRAVQGGALFNQENVPCEALFYSVLHVLEPRRKGPEGEPGKWLTALLDQNRSLQIGGDETTGHGLCETNLKPLP